LSELRCDCDGCSIGADGASKRGREQERDWAGLTTSFLTLARELLVLFL
jgi:hypothetical protein